MIRSSFVLLGSLLLAFSLAPVACGGDDSASGVSPQDGGTGDGSSAVDGNSGDASRSGTDGSSGDAGVFVPGDPIIGLTPGAWTWVDVAGTKCRDGSSTGIGVSPSATGSKKLMIFLEGGGACFNSTTCGSNPATFGSVQFAGFPTGEGMTGIFARGDAANPVADWNMVYVPYCTGDIHGGSAENVAVPGTLGSQQFVGYRNMTLDLERIEPTFPGATQVLLTGQSAGGFGAALNYVQTARAFSGVNVALADDSGPLFANPTLAACLATAQTTLWGMGGTVLADCGSDCSDPGNALNQYWTHLAKTYPSAPLGFLESTGDGVISNFLGFGADNCTSFAATTPEAFEAALLAMRSEVAGDPNAGLFLFAGTDHTSIVDAYTIRTAPAVDGGTVKLESWLTGLLNGDVQNIGP